MSKHKGCGHAHPKIDPFRFMEMDKHDIHYKLTGELGYPEEEALREFHCMTEMLTLLRSMRPCQSQTDDYLKDAVPLLHRGVKLLTVTILLNATKDDDTYCHAYNTFVYYSNRYMRTNHPRKNISDHQLLLLLEAEKKAALEESPKDTKGKVFLKDVALKHAWENKQINQQNMDEIAAHYGFKSGIKLYRDYIEVMKRADRIADPDGTARMMKYKIMIFERASAIVSPEFKNKALEEIDILRSILKKVYLSN
jgi:hypothetical protein